MDTSPIGAEGMAARLRSVRPNSARTSSSEKIKGRLESRLFKRTALNQGICSSARSPEKMRLRPNSNSAS